MPRFRCALILIITYLLTQPLCLSQAKKHSGAPKLSEETRACIECHKVVTPGIVEDWLTSRHSKVTPAEGISRPALERRVSSDTIAASLRSVTVGCFECHSQNTAGHKDSFDHFGYTINVIVSPNDCKVCHRTEAEQFSEGKKASAFANLADNAVYHTLVQVVDGMKAVDGHNVRSGEASAVTKGETCYACHGTKVEVRGKKTVTSSIGDVEVPDLSNWPNQGVGRVNPDGSTGACTACHPRHSFSIEIARKPFTCSQCHLEPDVPAWDVYRESKHGNIILSRESAQDWDAVPWRIGKDLRAPTCATCHNSLLATPEGEALVQRSHNFGARLWVRIFGLIYSHPQPKSGSTSVIRNRDGLPLPVTFTGQLATDYLIDKAEQDRREETMKNVCRGCHGSSWADAHFAKFGRTNIEIDSMVLAATKLIQQAWDAGLADKSNPFDEAFEQRWVEEWLFYANSVRYGSAMAGPDYETFERGWWDLTHNLEEMRDQLSHSQAKGK